MISWLSMMSHILDWYNWSLLFLCIDNRYFPHPKMIHYLLSMIETLIMCWAMQPWIDQGWSCIDQFQISHCSVCLKTCVLLTDRFKKWTQIQGTSDGYTCRLCRSRCRLCRPEIGRVYRGMPINVLQENCLFHNPTFFMPQKIPVLQYRHFYSH